MISSSLPVVTSNKIFESGGKRLHRDGIFSEHIFGPLISFQCWCDTPNYQKKLNEPCPGCGIPFASSSMRRNQFAVIKLPEKVVSGPAYILIKKFIKLNKYYKHIISGGMIKFSKKPEMIKSNLEEEDNCLGGLEALEKVILYFKESGINNNYLNGLIRLMETDRFYTNEVLVIPPDLRSYTPEGGMDEISKSYIQILINVNILHSKGVGSFLRKKRILSIQQCVDGLRETIIKKLEGKEGLLRSTSGKRIDWSGRGVIVPINHGDYIMMPIVMALELYKLEVTRILSLSRKLPVMIAINEINEMIEREVVSKEVRDILEKVVENEVVVINRQPTLHRGSMFAMKVKIWDHQAIGIPKTICHPTNADFDGDSVIGKVDLYSNLSNNFQDHLVFSGDMEDLYKKYCNK